MYMPRIYWIFGEAFTLKWYFLFSGGMLPVSACLADDQVMLTIKPGNDNTESNNDCYHDK